MAVDFLQKHFEVEEEGIEVDQEQNSNMQQTSRFNIWPSL